MEVDQEAGEGAEAQGVPPEEGSTTRRERAGQQDISGRQGSPTGQDNIAGASQQTGDAALPAPGRTVKMDEELGAMRSSSSPKNLAD